MTKYEILKGKYWKSSLYALLTRDFYRQWQISPAIWQPQSRMRLTILSTTGLMGYELNALPKPRMAKLQQP